LQSPLNSHKFYAGAPDLYSLHGIAEKGASCLPHMFDAGKLNNTSPRKKDPSDMKKPRKFQGQQLGEGHLPAARHHV